jgi:hypothetical protein
MSSEYRYIGKDGMPILARDLEDQRDAALAKLEQIEKAWSMALYGDLEHGVASLNEKAHRAFNKGYPNIAAFGSNLVRILYDGETE